MGFGLFDEDEVNSGLRLAGREISKKLEELEQYENQISRTQAVVGLGEIDAVRNWALIAYGSVIG